MNRLEEVRKFLEFDRQARFFIEPEQRYEAVRDRLFDVLNNYKPAVTVKAGLGSGRLVLDMARQSKTYLAVVEPSWMLIQDFLRENAGDEALGRIQIIPGDFHDFPVDYYKADLLVCVDHLDIFDSSRSMDEFRRALQFEGIFFFAGVILRADDLEGVYDDYKRLVFPLHNDYYLEEDFKTFMELKDFTFIKSMTTSFPKNLGEERASLQSYQGELPGPKAEDFLREHGEEFRKLYGLDDAGNISEAYLIAYFMKNQVEEKERDRL